MKFTVIHDAPSPCPYLPGQTSRMPLRLPLEPIDPDAFDELLEQGDRRFGALLYRTECHDCSACEAIRVPIKDFVASRSQRRVWKRNTDEVTVRIVRPMVTETHLDLFNRHKQQRGLSTNEEGSTDNDSYRFHLVQTCVQTHEIQYLVKGRLVAVSILDFGRRSASSVYHYFDPDESDRSLGVYSVLREIELCKELGLDWYYLGLYVQNCRNLSYKSQYYPHQRRIDGAWRAFESRGP